MLIKVVLSKKTYLIFVSADCAHKLEAKILSKYTLGSNYDFLTKKNRYANIPYSEVEPCSSKIGATVYNSTN